MLTCDQYLMPETLGQALTQRAGAPPGSRLVAGATDTLPWAREGRAGDIHVPHLIDVSKIAELHGYEISDGRVRLGANLVFQRFLSHDTLKAHLPCMPYCAIWFGDDQIREQATLVGNIVNASPAADGTPPVLAMNGTVELARLDGGEVARRTVPVAEFVTGPGTTTRGGDEIVTAVECDSMAGYGGAFEKVGQRRSLVISTVCVAGLVKPSADNTTFQDVRLAIGGTGPVPLRLNHIEDFLKNRPLTRDILRQASQMTSGLINSRTRRAYRGDVLSGFIERALEDALADCGVHIPSDSIKEAANV
jgi:carbon-monoxide dehydrogenase medium subunit/xanthine dehydrogenase FAD-binding subunit